MGLKITFKSLSVYCRGDMWWSIVPDCQAAVRESPLTEFVIDRRQLKNDSLRQSAVCLDLERICLCH